MKNNPTIVLLHGYGPISINNELLELYPVTTSHGAIGFPLKSLRAENVTIVTNIINFWSLSKKLKPENMCYLYAYDGLQDVELEKIKADNIQYL
ncbi:hypothetical protein [Sulfurimonas microaerophilic]|uniref:hypothetical protein n=1 Tax=Sulfurimonas microaerophilic TaxID=3058392 RepID=UPI002714A59E|nr:hypothetical protein [Sulfurimonas sp. hsl 1-7]